VPGGGLWQVYGINPLIPHKKSEPRTSVSVAQLYSMLFLGVAHKGRRRRLVLGGGLWQVCSINSVIPPKKSEPRTSVSVAQLYSTLFIGVGTKGGGD
jgi:hypothetical protein